MPTIQYKKLTDKVIQMNSKITSESDVIKFIRDIYQHLQLNFHPDDPFINYVDNNSIELFSELQASKLDNILAQCISLIGEDKFYDLLFKLNNEIVWNGKGPGQEIVESNKGIITLKDDETMGINAGNYKILNDNIDEYELQNIITGEIVSLTKDYVEGNGYWENSGIGISKMSLTESNVSDSSLADDLKAKDNDSKSEPLHLADDLDIKDTVVDKDHVYTIDLQKLPAQIKESKTFRYITSKSPYMNFKNVYSIAEEFASYTKIKNVINKAISWFKNTFISVNIDWKNVSNTENIEYSIEDGFIYLRMTDNNVDTKYKFGEITTFNGALNNEDNNVQNGTVDGVLYKEFDNVKYCFNTKFDFVDGKLYVNKVDFSNMFVEQNINENKSELKKQRDELIKLRDNAFNSKDTKTATKYIKQISKLNQEIYPERYKNIIKENINDKLTFKDLPENTQELVDAGKVTYRGAGMGKYAGYYKLKVNGKEYFVTIDELTGFEKNGNKIRFAAPYRRNESIVNESIVGRNYPDKITGDYEGNPNDISGFELYELLENGLKTTKNVEDFIKFITYGITDETSELSSEDQEKLITWYNKNKNNDILLTYIKTDEDTGNFIYKGSNNKMYVSLDGDIYDMTDDGEPDSPVHNVKIASKQPIYNPEDRFGRNPGSKIQEYRVSYTPGLKAKISSGSGIDSDKIVTIVPQSRIKLGSHGVPTNVVGAYKAPDWSKEVAIQYSNGQYGLMFKNRLTIIKNINESTSNPNVKFYNGNVFFSSGKLADVKDHKDRFGDDITFSVNGIDKIFNNIEEYKKYIKQFDIIGKGYISDEEREEAKKRVFKKRVLNESSDLSNWPTSLMFTKDIVDVNNKMIPMDTVLDITFRNNVRVVLNDTYIMKTSDFIWHYENGNIEADSMENDTNNNYL